MAGARLKLEHPYIEVTDSGILEALERLQELGGDMRTPFNDVGAYLDRKTEERFSAEAGPGGVPWLDVKPETRKRKKHPKILTETMRLRGSFAFEAREDELVFGTNVGDYPAVHQFGGKHTPARPFLGLDGDDEAAIVEIFLDEVERVAKGG